MDAPNVQQQTQVLTRDSDEDRCEPQAGRGKGEGGRGGMRRGCECARSEEACGHSGAGTCSKERPAHRGLAVLACAHRSGCCPPGNLCMGAYSFWVFCLRSGCDWHAVIAPYGLDHCTQGSSGWAASLETVANTSSCSLALGLEVTIQLD